MITKSKFFALSAVILIVFVMFQFIGDSVDIFYDFDKNESASYTPAYTKTDADEAGYSSYACFANPKGEVAIVTENETDLPAVTDACDYLKLRYALYDNISELDYNNTEKYALVVMGCCEIDLARDIPIFKTFLSESVNMIFAVLPDLSLMKNQQLTSSMTGSERTAATEMNSLRRDLRQIIGAHTIESDAKKIDGITLFDGFLLGGKAIYEKTDEMTIPHISRLFASTKAYVMGILNDDWESGNEYRNEILPHIVWRNSYTGSYVFTVNADFMRHSTGIGFFTGMMSEMCDAFAYPIINAQIMSLESLPSLSNENSTELSKYFNQTLEYFFQTNVLPSVNSVLDQTNFMPTYFVLSRFSRTGAIDASDETYKNLMLFYLKQARKKNGEIGISAYSEDGGSERFLADLELFGRILPEYKFTLLYTGNLTRDEYTALLNENDALANITTVVLPMPDEKDIEKFGYISENILAVPQTDNGYVHSDNDDIALRSIMSAIGCSNIGVDGLKIAYPDDGRDFTTLATDWSRFTYTNWYPFRKFDHLTLTEADARIRSYLNTSYEITQSDRTTHIHATNFDGEGYLMLTATNEKVKSAVGCTYVRIEEGTYLISMTEADASVTMTNTRAGKFKQ